MRLLLIIGPPAVGKMTVGRAIADRSYANVLELEAEHRMSSSPDLDAPGERLLARWPHLVIDNTDLSADEAAERILAWLVTDQ